MVWHSDQRWQRLEQELVKRQQESQVEAADARLAARQAQELARETASKAALIDAKVGQLTAQRAQIDELLQSISRTRDDNLVADLESALQMAQQQAALMGNAEPLVATLRSIDDRLARGGWARFETMRQAIARDLEGIKNLPSPDVSTLAVRLDEAVALVDRVPLRNARAAAHHRPVAASDAGAIEVTATDAVGGSHAASASGVASAASAVSEREGAASLAAASAPPTMQAGASAVDAQGDTVAVAPTDTAASAAPLARLAQSAEAMAASSAPALVLDDAQAGATAESSVWARLRQWWLPAWTELRALVRVSRIDQPEAVLIAPEQSYFLRENLKLKLLNARLSLLARQHGMVQSDLREAQSALERYFDTRSRESAALTSVMSEVGAQAQQIVIPRPDQSLTWLQTVMAPSPNPAR